MFGFDDTIVAISSPPGRAARGIVRLSGPEALQSVSGSFEPVIDPDVSGSRRVRGEWRLLSPEGYATTTIPAEMWIFRAPHSFTKQDCVEIHTLGSPTILGMLVAQLVAAGVRQAEPGEFTARAFLSGRIDLTQAEAVAQVIRARSEGQLRAARRVLDGALAQRIAALREQLTDLVSLVEADIDFAEEPIEFITPPVLRVRLDVLRDDLHALLADSRSAQRLDVVPRVLLLGGPNVGKSSLLNALSGLDRAICSAVAGTTRDVLSAPIKLAGGEAILLDAAGLDETNDPLLSLARRRLRSVADTADLICLVVDASHLAKSPAAPWAAPLEQLLGRAPHGSAAACPTLVAANKVDLLDAEQVDRVVEALSRSRPGPVCPVSALMGAGLDELRHVVAEQLHLHADSAAAGAIHLTLRQADAIETATACLRRAASQCEGIAQTAQAADLIAFDLREALDALGSVSGAVTTEDLLTRIFSSFCVGK